MGGGGADDDHRRPGKNGHDHLQDKEIREIQLRFEEWEKVFGEFAREDTQTHARIEHKVDRLYSDSVWERRIGVAILTALAALFGWGVQYLVDTESRLDEVARESRDHIKEGMQIGRDLQRQVDRLDEEVHELQKIHRVVPKGKE